MIKMIKIKLFIARPKQLEPSTVVMQMTHLLWDKGDGQVLALGFPSYDVFCAIQRELHSVFVTELVDIWFCRTHLSKTGNLVCFLQNQIFTSFLLPAITFRSTIDSK